VRILSRSRDLYFDLAGGNRIPKIGERKARSVAELRSAGIGVSHVMLVHDNTLASSDLFAAALTMLDPEVALTVVSMADKTALPSENNWLQQDLARAERLRREVEVCQLPEGDPAEELVNQAQKLGCDLLVLGVTDEPFASGRATLDAQAVAKKSVCPVCLIVPPGIPQEVDE
jgi:nucleotide-binding universal stress UspA family protein